MNNLSNYGVEGIEHKTKNACAFRLLTVKSSIQGKGIGKQLVSFCIEKGRKLKRTNLIIHSTLPMKVAWNMYIKLGFVRDENLDFERDHIKIFGFNYNL